MKIVIFGLSISSAWGNGHATLWRGLCRELAGLGHRVVFFEKDLEYYRAHRDYESIPNGELAFYESWERITPKAREQLTGADCGIVTSYCPDAVDAAELLLGSQCRLRVFYDLDAPVTIDRIRRGQDVDYVGPRGYGGFDLVLSYTGGKALDDLRSVLNAQHVEPLYGSVDPQVHRTSEPIEEFRADLSYLGTYAPDRQPAVDELLLRPAAALPGKRFLIGGSQYPRDFSWRPNLFYRDHVKPSEHSAFYCSSPLTLNVTRPAMADSGWCPSGRLFEAAACGAAIVSDTWDGLDHFYSPDTELLVCRDSSDVVAAIRMPQHRIREVAEAARLRTLREHTARHRAMEMLSLLDSAATRASKFAEAPLCGV